MFKQISFAFVTVAALIFAGCQSSGTHESAAARTDGKTVTCDQCNASWQQKMVVNDKGVSVPQLSASKADTCPTCRKAAEGYFATGETPRCQSCGGKMRVME